MKKTLILMICCGFFLAGCAKTAYDVTRLTQQSRGARYFSGPIMNNCKLTFDVDTGDFRMLLHDPPQSKHVTDASEGKYDLHYDPSGKYILLTKKYLESHRKSGLSFDDGKYSLPGFYVDGFMARMPVWSQ